MAAATGFSRGCSPSLYPVSIPHSLTSTSSCYFASSFHPIRSISSRRTSHSLRNNRKIVVCMRQDDSEVINLVWKKRAILIVGFSVLPFLKMNDKTLECLAAEVSELKGEEENQALESKLSGGSSVGSFVSVLGGIGVFVSGVLGALYALAQKEKAISEATIESMRHKLHEKETAIVSLGKKFESELMKEKEAGNEKLRKARDEQHSLTNQLKSAYETLSSIKQELQKEKKMVEELEMSINGLQIDLTTAAVEKKSLEEDLRGKDEAISTLQDKINLVNVEIKEKVDDLHNLRSELAEKETELKSSVSECQQLQDELGKLNLEKKELKDKLLRSEKELELKNATITDLNAQIGALQRERDESNRTLESIRKEYTELKSFSQKKEAEDAKLLKDQERKVHQLKEQLESSLSELNSKNIVVADISLERDSLRKMLGVELENVKDLNHKLQVARETLEKSKREVVELTRQLQQSHDLCLGLESEVSKVRADLGEARQSLTKKAEEAKQEAESLASELTSLREILQRKNEEMQTVSQDLAMVIQIRDSLQQELVDAYKKAEIAVADLQEEKKVTSSLNNDLKALETRVLKEQEARKSLQVDLENATRTLDELNGNALILTKELELANSQLSINEDEKHAIYKSLADQKHETKVARENLEDAHSLVMKLGEERQKLEKRAKKLEDDLATAKGEILRLRSPKSSSSKTLVNDKHQEGVEVVGVSKTVNDKHQEDVKVGAAKAAATPTKRSTSRTRKVVPRKDTGS